MCVCINTDYIIFDYICLFDLFCKFNEILKCKYIKNTWITQESENTYFHCGPVTNKAGIRLSSISVSC